MLAAIAVLGKSHAALDALIALGADMVEAHGELMEKEDWRGARFLTETGRVR
jgi:hypothetical protein